MINTYLENDKTVSHITTSLLRQYIYFILFFNIQGAGGEFGPGGRVSSHYPDASIGKLTNF